MMKFLEVKRRLALLLSGIMIVSALTAGCGKSGSESPATSSASTGEVSASTTVSEEEPYEINWYTIGTPQKDIPTVMEELNKYTMKKINAKIKMTQFDWGEYTDKMNVIINSGEPYDICFTCSWANQYIPNVAKGAFLPLDELLKKEGKGILEAVDPLFIEANKVNGKLYAVPTNKELCPQTRWLFNKELVDKYKFDISKPMSFEDIEPLLKTVKEGEKGLSDVLLVRNDWNLPRYFDDYEWAGTNQIPLVLPMTSKDNKLVNFFEQPDVLKNLETMRKYFLAGYVKKDAASSTDQDFIKTGKWFVRIGGWLPGADQIWTRSEKAPVVSTPITGNLYVSQSQLSGSMMAISVSSKNPDKTMQFLNLLNTDKVVRNMVDSGIENVHYKMENGKQVDLDKAQDYNMPSFSLGNRLICNLFKDDPDDLWDQYKKFNSSGIKSPLIGFNANLDSVKKEVAALNNVYAEYYRPIVTGTVDYKSYLPKYMNKLKGNGLDKVRTELQKQIDQYKTK